MAAEEFSKGNEAFVEEDYEKAEQLYTAALALEDTRDDIWTARAQARIKLEKYQDALADASKAIDLNEGNVKAYLRKGIACFHLGQFELARDILSHGHALNDSEKNFSTWLRKCEAEIDLQKKTAETTKEKTCPAAVTVDEDNKSDVKPEVKEVPMPTGPRTRYDWYQTESHVIITILIKNVKSQDLQSQMEKYSLSIDIKLPTGSDYALHLDFPHQICPEQSSVKILSTKVEIKLKKAEGIRWEKLEGEPQADVKHFKPAPIPEVVKKYPSSSHHTRDWDKLAADIAKEEKDEKLEGDAALNQLFQQIYADGSDEVRRAMNKSFMESGGTVLSTNWGEIKEKKTEVKPPDGMEFKQYSS